MKNKLEVDDLFFQQEEYVKSESIHSLFESFLLILFQLQSGCCILCNIRCQDLLCFPFVNWQKLLMVAVQRTGLLGAKETLRPSLFQDQDKSWKSAKTFFEREMKMTLRFTEHILETNFLARRNHLEKIFGVFLPFFWTPPTPPNPNWRCARFESRKLLVNDQWS